MWTIERNKIGTERSMEKSLEKANQAELAPDETDYARVCEANLFWQNVSGNQNVTFGLHFQNVLANIQRANSYISVSELRYGNTGRFLQCLPL